MSPRASFLYVLALASLCMVTAVILGVTWAPIILSVASQDTLTRISGLATSVSVILTVVRTSYWLRDRKHAANKAAP